MVNETDPTGDPERLAEARLEALLAEARELQPGADLTARVLAEARAMQAAGAPSVARPARSSSRAGRVADLLGALGGWAGLGGVTAAGLVGLAIGFWASDSIGVIGAGPLSFLAPAESGLLPDLAALALEPDDV